MQTTAPRTWFSPIEAVINGQHLTIRRTARALPLFVYRFEGEQTGVVSLSLTFEGDPLPAYAFSAAAAPGQQLTFDTAVWMACERQGEGMTLSHTWPNAEPGMHCALYWTY